MDSTSGHSRQGGDLLSQTFRNLEAETDRRRERIKRAKELLDKKRSRTELLDRILKNLVSSRGDSQDSPRVPEEEPAHEQRHLPKKRSPTNLDLQQDQPRNEERDLPQKEKKPTEVLSSMPETSEKAKFQAKISLKSPSFDAMKLKSYFPTKKGNQPNKRSSKRHSRRFYHWSPQKYYLIGENPIEDKPPKQGPVLNSTLNTSKKLKIEGRQCRFNVHRARRFIFNREIDMFESQFVEFKRLKGLHLQMILNYIGGFLNSFGGSLYIGISDDGRIKGISLSRDDIDQFQIDLDRSLRQFIPTVFPDQIRVQFSEICLNKKLKYVLADKFIVQIDVFCSNLMNIYINNEGLVHIRKNGSLNTLSTRELIEFTRQRVLQDPSTILINPESLNFNPKLFQKLGGHDKQRIHSTINEFLSRLNP